MTVDISRVSFVPRKNYSAPVEQQGRVALDADGTEAWAIQDRRWRSGTMDLTGRVHVPVTLPDSFRIDVSGGELLIQPGRLYVDGLQAENHGAAPEVFDPVLAENTGTVPVPFDEQPYRPGFVPGPPAPGRHVVLLDVWQRTVTPIEDPSLIEPAIGVDTTGRVQTVWQVRTLPDVGDATCSTPDGELPGWAALTAPSAGRLSSRAHVGPPQTDPCLLPPGSGYTGLENRTYRVEIHDESAAGTFRFKWAMYNATVASPVIAVPAASVLRVARVARDDVMRFNPGDWIEITDDRRELEGQPGVMAQVQAVNDAQQTITLTEPLPAGTIALSVGDAADPQYHPRVRKWDQAGLVRDSAGNVLTDLTTAGSPGVIEVPASGTWVQLGDGVEVSFDLLAGGRFRVGDYWVFTARTAGREVEQLVEAPPFGIHHHYCRLAVVDANAEGWIAPVVEDCRPRPEATASCCTIIVQPGDDIQAAVDALPDVGGCVCLKAGIHFIRTPVQITRDNVEIHGESLGATIVALTGGAFVIGNGGIEGVRIHEVRFQQRNAAAPVIVSGQALHPVISNCIFEVDADDERGAASIAVMARGTRDITIEDCSLNGFAIGIWLSERCNSGCIANNRLVMGRPGPNSPITIGIGVEQTIGMVNVENNDISRAVRGIVINDRPDEVPVSLATGSIVRDNLVSLTVAEGVIGHAIDVAAERSSVEGNRISLPAGNVAGIRICGSGSRVAGNIINARGEQGIGTAIIVGNEQDGQFLALERIIIAGNVVSGRVNGMGLLGVNHAEVTGNMLGEIGSPMGVGIALGNSNDCTVASNRLIGAVAAVFCDGCSRTVLADNRLEGGQIGMMLNGAGEPTIRGNVIREVASYAVVLLGSTGRTEVVGNRINRCGWVLPVAVGIGAALVYGELHVDGNEVVDTGLPPAAGGQPAAGAQGIVAELVLEARVTGNLVTYTDPASRPVAAEDRALRMRGLLEIQINLGAEAIVMGYGVQIAHNRFIGTGASALVELNQSNLTDTVRIRFERVQFDDNYCLHLSPPLTDGQQAATVSLVGRRGTVSGNQVKANTRAFPSYHFHGMPGPFIGNVSNGGNLGRPVANQFPAPENAFNQIA